MHRVSSIFVEFLMALTFVVGCRLSNYKDKYSKNDTLLKTDIISEMMDLN